MNKTTKNNLPEGPQISVLRVYLCPIKEVYRSNKNIGIAWMSLRNHFDKLIRLYEQGASQKRIGEYVKGRLLWVRSGVGPWKLFRQDLQDEQDKGMNGTRMNTDDTDQRDFSGEGNSLSMRDKTKGYLEYCGKGF